MERIDSRSRLIQQQQQSDVERMIRQQQQQQQQLPRQQSRGGLGGGGGELGGAGVWQEAAPRLPSHNNQTTITSYWQSLPSQLHY